PPVVDLGAVSPGGPHLVTGLTGDHTGLRLPLQGVEVGGFHGLPDGEPAPGLGDRDSLCALTDTFVGAGLERLAPAGSLVAPGERVTPELRVVLQVQGKVRTAIFGGGVLNGQRPQPVPG